MKGRWALILGLVSGDEGKKSRLLWLSGVQAGVGTQPRRVLCHCLTVSKGTPRGANHCWPGRQCAYSLSGVLPLPFSCDLPVLVLVRENPFRVSGTPRQRSCQLAFPKAHMPVPMAFPQGADFCSTLPICQSPSFRYVALCVVPF